MARISPAGRSTTCRARRPIPTESTRRRPRAGSARSFSAPTTAARPGYPTNHFLSTTVLHPNAAEADALATAFFVMQLDEIAALCEQNEEIEAIVVLNEPGRSKISVELFNVDEETVRVLD